MKTWEMIKKLTENPSKKFKRVGDGLEVSVDIDDCLLWKSGHTPFNINHIWEEVKEAVTWEKAFQAGLQGKKIKPSGQSVTYPEYESLDYAIPYLAERPSYYKKLMLGEWYIED